MKVILFHRNQMYRADIIKTRFGGARFGKTFVSSISEKMNAGVPGICILTCLHLWCLAFAGNGIRESLVSMRRGFRRIFGRSDFKCILFMDEGSADGTCQTLDQFLAAKRAMTIFTQVHIHDCLLKGRVSLNTTALRSFGQLLLLPSLRMKLFELVAEADTQSRARSLFCAAKL
jgi:hypothetical protein